MNLPSARTGKDLGLWSKRLVSITPRRVICSFHILSMVSLKARTNFSRSCCCWSLPFCGVIAKVGIGVNCDLEIGTGAAGEEILVNFLEGDAWVEVDVMLLLLGLFKDEFAHELAEQLAHGIHARLACGHVAEGVAHGEEYCLYAARVGTVVHFDVTLADVRHGDDGGGGLELLEGFLEAVKTADLGEGEGMGLGEFVGGCEPLEKGGGIPSPTPKPLPGGEGRDMLLLGHKY